MESLVGNSSTPGLNETPFESSHLDSLSQLLEKIHSQVFSTLIWIIVSTGAAGVTGNILTLLVYIKLGFSETINISFAALAVSDLCCVLITVWIGLCYTPVLDALPFRFRVEQDIHLFASSTGGWIHIAFSRTTALITAWISLERCLCVLFPTRVKIVVSRTVTKVVLTTIFIVAFCPLGILYLGLEFQLSFDTENNKTILLIPFNLQDDLIILKRLAFFLYGAVYPVFSCLTVTICTAFLVVKLRQSARWRKANALVTTSTAQSAGTNPRSVYRRDNRTMRTVVMICSCFVVCSLPMSTSLIAVTLDRKVYSFRGSFHHMVSITTAVSIYFSQINSSLNIVFYVITGSRFRSTLIEMFSLKSRRD